MSDIAAQHWKRLRLCARLLVATSITSFALFLFSLFFATLIYSPFNSWVVAFAGGGVSISGTFPDNLIVASQTSTRIISIVPRGQDHRFGRSTFDYIWHARGFREINIPLQFAGIALLTLAGLATKRARVIAIRGGICRHCGYPAPFPLKPCPECGRPRPQKTA